MALTFDEAFKRFWPYVCAIVYSKLNEDGGEIASKVFYKLSLVYNNGEDFNNDLALKGWLSVTTSRMCMDYQRVRKRYLNVLEGYRTEAENMPQQTEETTDEDRSEIEQYVINFIYNEINNLPPKTKQVFDLHYFKNLTYRQIAKQLNVSKQTVLNQLQNARLQLRLNILFDKKTAPLLGRRLLFKPGEK